MHDSESDSDLMLEEMFPGPRAATPDATVAVHTRADGSAVTLRVVGSHPLWGHYVWNAARSLARYLDEHAEVVRGRAVLELGAGCGLAGIVAGLNGGRVVLTDYPDRELVANLAVNVAGNVSGLCVHVEGYVWGHPTGVLRGHAPHGFDVVLLSDVVFNHSQHDALLDTCTACLAPSGCLLVFYTHHRPHLAHRDTAFFDNARTRGWVCHEIVTDVYPQPMFPHDPGDERERRTVHGWRCERGGAGRDAL